MDEDKLDDECLLELLDKEDFDLLFEGPLELIEEELFGEDNDDDDDDKEDDDGEFLFGGDDDDDEEDVQSFF